MVKRPSAVARAAALMMFLFATSWPPHLTAALECGEEADGPECTTDPWSRSRAAVDASERDMRSRLQRDRVLASAQQLLARMCEHRSNGRRVPGVGRIIECGENTTCAFCEFESGAWATPEVLALKRGLVDLARTLPEVDLAIVGETDCERIQRADAVKCLDAMNQHQRSEDRSAMSHGASNRLLSFCRAVPVPIQSDMSLPDNVIAVGIGFDNQARDSGASGPACDETGASRGARAPTGANRSYRRITVAVAPSLHARPQQVGRRCAVDSGASARDLLNCYEDSTELVSANRRPLGTPLFPSERRPTPGGAQPGEASTSHVFNGSAAGDALIAWGTQMRRVRISAIGEIGAPPLVSDVLSALRSSRSPRE